MPDPVDLRQAFKLPPRQAVEYFRSKGYEITFAWWEMWQAQHARAFTVAKVMTLELLEDIRAEFDAALERGETARTFANNLEPILRAKGWWGRLPLLDEDGAPILRDDGTSRTYQAGSPWRLKNIYRTNKGVAYNTGRWRAFQAAKRLRPYLEYVAIDDSRVRPSHLALNGRVYHVDDPIWQWLAPPNGWGCRCRLRSRSEREIEQRGLVVSSSEGQIEQITQEVGVDPRSGEVIEAPGVRWTDPLSGDTLEPDPGWSYNPGAAGDQVLEELLQRKSAELGVAPPQR